MDQTTNQSSSTVIWYVVGIAVIVALAFWYFYGKQAPTTDTQSTTVGQTQEPAQSNGNTTTNISAELNQVSNTSSALDADAAASATSVNGF